ncbi:hypothetical protein GCM10028807_00780 [Spirosoma daeguense]
MSNYERNANRLTNALFVILIALSVGGAIWLPSPIPIHYNMAGQADRWGSPATLLVLPVIAFFTLGILYATRKVHPDFMNFPGPRTPENVARQLQNAYQMMATLRVFIVCLFLSIQVQTIWAKLHNQNQLLGWTIPILTATPLLLAGFFIWRAYKLIPRP